MTPRVREVLSWYASENPGVITNLTRLFNFGELSGTGRACFLVSPETYSKNLVSSLCQNQNSYDPNYHLELAMDSGVSAYIADYGTLQACLPQYAGEIPMLLNLNTMNNDVLTYTSEPKQALQLGCVGVSISIHQKSLLDNTQVQKLQKVFYQSKELGLVCVLHIFGNNELDQVAENTRIAVQLGAHITIVPMPSGQILNSTQEQAYKLVKLKFKKPVDRIKHITDCAFSGRRIVMIKQDDEISLNDCIIEAKDIARAGSFGTMVGLNGFKLSKEETIEGLSQLMSNFKAKEF